MPDDERRTVYVPVDPEAYGLGMLLGWLGPQGCGFIFMAAVVVSLISLGIYGIFGIKDAADKYSKYGTTDNYEIGQILEKQTQSAQESQDKMVKEQYISELKSNGVIQLNRNEVFYPGQTYEGSIQVDRIEFQNDQFLVYFSINNFPNDFVMEETCLKGAWEGIVSDIRYTNRNVEVWNGNSASGYFAFSYSDLITRDGVYFVFGCKEKAWSVPSILMWRSIRDGIYYHPKFAYSKY